MVDVTIRPAAAGDASAIAALVRSERLNPTGLGWAAFDVAVADGVVAGAVQLRRHGAGSAELGSLVVRRDLRGRGVGARLMAEALDRAPAETWVVTTARHATPWMRRGFRPGRLAEAPWPVLVNVVMGQAATLTRLASGQRPRRVALLVRRTAEALERAVPRDADPPFMPRRIG